MRSLDNEASAADSAREDGVLPAHEVEATVDADTIASANGLVLVLFQLGMLLIGISAMLWFIGGFIGGRGLAKRFFLWGAVTAGFSTIGASGLIALMETLSGLPLWFILTFSTIVVAFVILGLFSAFARLFMSADAADAMVGDLAASLVKAVLVPFRGPFRALRRLIADSWRHP